MSIAHFLSRFDDDDRAGFVRTAFDHGNKLRRLVTLQQVTLLLHRHLLAVKWLENTLTGRFPVETWEALSLVQLLIGIDDGGLLAAVLDAGAPSLRWLVVAERAAS